MKKITLITQLFPPEFAATGQLLNELSDKLVAQGYKIEIYTGQKKDKKNHHKKLIYTLKNKRIFKQKLLFCNPKEIYKKIINSIVFTLFVFKNILKGKFKNSMSIFTTEPAYLPLIGYINYLISRNKYLLIIFDLYPDIIINNKIIKPQNPIIKLWEFFIKRSYENASKIIVLNNFTKNKISNKYSINKSNIEVIPTWANQEKIYPIKKHENKFAAFHNQVGKFTILYSGNQGRCHDFKTIMETVKILKNENFINFIFIGNGFYNKYIRDFCKDNNLKNCKILPFQNYDELNFSLNCADLAFISISEESVNLVVPSKINCHLACGTPIALICPKNSEIYKIIKSKRLGESFTNYSSEKLSKWILKLSKDKKLQDFYYNNSLDYFRKNYSLEIVSKKYIELLKSLS